MIAAQAYIDRWRGLNSRLKSDSDVHKRPKQIPNMV